MTLEDASLTGLVGFVRSVERIRDDGCVRNREGEDDDDRENPPCHYIEPW